MTSEVGWTAICAHETALKNLPELRPVHVGFASCPRMVLAQLLPLTLDCTVVYPFLPNDGCACETMAAWYLLYLPMPQSSEPDAPAKASLALGLSTIVQDLEELRRLSYGSCR